MKKEVADAWVKALRSGKYTQTKHKLKKDDKFCCLGVLCDISKLDEFKARYDGANEQYFGISSAIPHQVLTYSGMHNSSGKLGNIGGSNYSLMYFNDTGYYNGQDQYINDTLTFDEIADVIQMCWREL